MQHIFPVRAAASALPWVVYLPLLIWSGLLFLWFCFWSPSWDVPIVYGIWLLLVLVVGGAGVLRWLTRRLVQVDHAGVVVSDVLFGRCLHRRVVLAEHLLAFDWEAIKGGLFACRILVRRDACSHCGRFMTLMQTRSPDRAAAMLRDLELHYPGSCLVAAYPNISQAEKAPSRLLAGGLLVAGLVLCHTVLPFIWQPLYVAAAGHQVAARVEYCDWQGGRGQSSYHLVVRIGTELHRSATSFTPNSRIPHRGQRLMVLCAPGKPFYMPAELTPFVLPLPVGYFVILLVVSSCYNLLFRPPKVALP